jgi:hypothetical protein
MADTTVTVDPGVNVGFAVWVDGSLVRYGSLNRIKRLTWQQAVEEMAIRFKTTILDGHLPNRVVCESPEFMQSTTGLVSARRGDLVKLAEVYGVLWGVCVSRGVPFVSIRIGDWKGQLSKSESTERTARLTGIKANEHAMDAIGIGLHWRKSRLLKT